MRRLGVRVVAMVLFVSASHVSSAPAAGSSEHSTADRRRPGPIGEDFAGWAYVVPANPKPGEHQNDVEVELYDAAGVLVGADFARAGRPWEILQTDGDTDQVAIAWDDGLTARTARRDFWVMPDFVGLKDMTVVNGGMSTPLGSSDLKYHRGSVGQLDDRDTPEHDGIMRLTREFLNCESEEWSIGQQTMTVDLVESGLHRNDKSLIDKGVIGLDWGVSVPAINEEGDFELYRACDGTTKLDFGGTHHTTQWLESMGRAVYLLAASEYAGEYRPKIASYIDHIEVVAERLARPDVFRAWQEKKLFDSFGNDFTHKTYMRAAGLGLASTLTDNAEDAARWEQGAESIARYGIDLQRENGVNPERGGFDVQYQMYGVWLAEIYYTTLGPDNAVKRDLEGAIDRAIAWLISRVDERTGQVVIDGSTRVCAEVNWWTGSPSEVLDTAETVRALLLWGHLHSDADLVERASFVSQGQREFGNECPPVDPDSSSADGDASSPANTQNEQVEARSRSNDRSFSTPIGDLSNRRVAAAALGGVLAFIALTVLGALRKSRLFALPIRVGGALVVFAGALVVLAA